MSFNRTLGPLYKILKTKTGVQAEAALVAAQGAEVQLQLVGITGHVIVGEVGKFLYIIEESEAIPIFQQSLATTGTTFTHMFSEEGIPFAKNKAMNWESDATSAEIVFCALYRINPPGG